MRKSNISPRLKAQLTRLCDKLETVFLKAAEEVLRPIQEKFISSAIEKKGKGISIDLKPFKNLLLSFLVQARQSGRFQGITEGLAQKQYYENRKKKLERKIIPVPKEISGLADTIIKDINILKSLSIKNKRIAQKFKVIPEKALSFYDKYVTKLVGDISESILSEARDKIYEHIRNGLVVDELKKDLELTFENFSNGRLTTIARTETANALNEGRMEAFSAPELKGFIVAFEFSAIMDSRVSDICESWNGLVIAVDDSRLKTPPFHYSCRSALIPINKYAFTEEGYDQRVGIGIDKALPPMEGFGG